MNQHKGRNRLFIITVAFLFVIVSGDEETNEIPKNHFHSSSIKHKDGSASDATSSSNTGKLGTSNGGATSLPEFLKSLNLQGLNIGKDSDTSASSISNGISSASNNGAQSLPPIFAGYHYPEPPIPGTPGPPGGGYPPFIPWGGADIGIIKVIEKVILVIGGGILLLVILAVLKGAIAKGGFLNNLGVNFSKAFSGATAVDVGPIHASAAGSAAVVNDPNFNRRVMDGVERRF